jgi:hypothetical protein
VIIAHFEVPPREASADNYAGAATFRIGAPANQNVRAFLRIAQEEYSSFDGECEAASNDDGKNLNCED